MTNQPPGHRRPKPPTLPRQAWNLARAMADFVADGLRTVAADEYRKRLEICDTCDQRRGNRCLKCGCRLALKARGRAFKCPLNKWRASQPDAAAHAVPQAPASETHNASETGKDPRSARR